MKNLVTDKLVEVIKQSSTSDNINFILGKKKNGDQRAIYDVIQDLFPSIKKDKKKKGKKKSPSSYSFYVDTRKKRKKKKNKHWKF